MRYARRISVGSVWVAAFVLMTETAFAAPFTLVRIGDVDGFGFPTTTGLVRATGTPHTTPADTNGNGRLEQTEFLPDLNHDGAVAFDAGDNFDNRSTNEILNIGIGGSGFTDLGSTGAKWTDIALSTTSTSFDPDGSDPFPDPGGPALPNEPEFVYSFHVNGPDVTTGANLFFNVVFGDYDVTPADITLTFASAPKRTIALNTQPGGSDGLIQAAFASLLFNEVFTADPSGGWVGFLKVNFVAPNEPYTAFDYTELSTTAISSTPVPEPGALVLLGTGGLYFMARARRRRQRANS